MQCVMPTGPSCAGRPAPTAGSVGWSACGRHVLGDRTGDSDPLVCPVWIVSRAPMPLPHRSSACWSQPNADGLVVGHVGPLVEGKRRELDRRDVCPGGPTGQRRAPDPAVKSSSRGSRTLHSRSRLRRVDAPGLYWARPARVPWPRPAGEFIGIRRAPPRGAHRTAPGAGCGEHARGSRRPRRCRCGEEFRGPGRRIAAALGRRHSAGWPCPLTCVETWRSSGEAVGETPRTIARHSPGAAAPTHEAVRCGDVSRSRCGAWGAIARTADSCRRCRRRSV